MEAFLSIQMLNLKLEETAEVGVERSVGHL